MTPLLQALTDAAKVGFDAPKCRRCDGCGQVQGEYTGYFRLCSLCHATGLDASDPERLIARAMVWLYTHKEHVLIPYDTGKVETVGLYRMDCDNPWYDRHYDTSSSEPHDGTPAGLATALLRLVARAGEAK